MGRLDFYAVELATERGHVLSRTFRTIAAARRWVKWCAQNYEARIVKCRPGQQAEVVR